MTAKLLTTHIPITHFLLFKELFFSHVLGESFKQGLKYASRRII